MINFSEDETIDRDDFNVREDTDDEISEVARLASLHEDEIIDDEGPIEDEGYQSDPI
jgi:hypothetical protein